MMPCARLSKCPDNMYEDMTCSVNRSSHLICNEIDERIVYSKLPIVFTNLGRFWTPLGSKEWEPEHPEHRSFSGRRIGTSEGDISYL